jgi:rhodanese-related sulfurtransferase
VDDAELAVAVAFPNFNQPIVCYCNGGNRGALAADRLVQQGYRKVASIAGGLRAVRAAGSAAPLETGSGPDAGAPLKVRQD